MMICVIIRLAAVGGRGVTAGYRASCPLPPPLHLHFPLSLTVTLIICVIIRLAAAIQLVNSKVANHPVETEQLLKFDPNKKIGLSTDAPPLSADYDVTYDPKIGNTGKSNKIFSSSFFELLILIRTEF